MDPVPLCVHVETPSLSDNSYKSIDDSQDCTPELILLESKKIDYYNDKSPKIKSRLPKLKLDLDIPENDDTDVQDKKTSTVRENDDFEHSKDLEKTLLVDQVFESENEEITGSTLKADEFTKCFSLNLKTDSDLIDVPRKELTSLSGYFQIPSSTFILPASVETNSSRNVFSNISLQSNNRTVNIQSNGPGCHYHDQFVKISSSTRDDCLISDKNCNMKIKECSIKINNVEKLEDQVSRTILNIYEGESWDSAADGITCIDLPAVSDEDIKTTGTESRITALDNASDANLLTSEEQIYSYLNKLTSSYIKIRTFFRIFAGKCKIWLKKGYEGFRNLISVIMTTRNPSPLANSELAQIIAAVKCDNEKVSLVLSQQISSLSQQLLEIQDKGETNFQLLKIEMSKMETGNNQLAKTNENLISEFQMLQNKVQELKSTISSRSSAITKNYTLTIPPSPQGIKVIDPPPPPPPPPPPTTLLDLKPNYSVTPNNRSNSNTLLKKLSTPLTSRPAITVEDLLKVTLRKAPQNLRSMENRRNTIPGPRGPVISLDMLRNVKLKSARRRCLDKSPRSASRLTRNRSQSNINLSPRSDSSLSRSLKPGDANKRVFKKLLPVSSNSENDLTRTRETLPTIFAMPVCKSESILN